VVVCGVIRADVGWDGPLAVAAGRMGVV
jgi:hypothetical protein